MSELIRIEVVIDPSRDEKFFAQWTCPKCNSTFCGADAEDKSWHPDPTIAITCALEAGETHACKVKP